jgi:uncharacterized integral membrane protein
VQLVWIVSLCFAVLIALFAVQNTTPVDVHVLVWRVEAVAVSTLVLASAALGALTTYLFGLARGIRHRVALRGNRSTIQQQDALIAELRAQVRELERENEVYRRSVESRERQAAEQARPVVVEAQRRVLPTPSSEGEPNDTGLPAPPSSP